MKFKGGLLFFSVSFSILIHVPSFAAYDKTWYQDSFWSGEYPNGVGVYKDNVQVPGRPFMNPDIPTTISCQLPFKAVIHPWNSTRTVEYVTASKIVPLQAMQDFEYETDMGLISAKKGDVLEYLIYYSEGMFAIRFKGAEYVVGQDILDYTDYANLHIPAPHEWFFINCVNGGSAWIFMKDLYVLNEQGKVVYFPGLGDWSPGFRQYGEVVDLSDSDLK